MATETDHNGQFRKTLICCSMCKPTYAVPTMNATNWQKTLAGHTQADCKASSAEVALYAVG